MPNIIPLAKNGNILFKEIFISGIVTPQNA